MPRCSSTGRQREKTFGKRSEADAFRVKVENDLKAGLYVDPAHRNITFAAWVEEWMAAQPHKASTADAYRRHLRNHMLPEFGARQLGAIKASQVQGWVKGLTAKGLAPSTVGTVYGIFASICKAAVADERLAKSPCVSIALPEVKRTTVSVLAPSQVHDLAEAMPERYRPLVYLGALAGLRQGEAFGVCLDRVEFLARGLRVDQQVSLVTGSGTGPVLTSPKTRASNRTVPLPALLLEVLAEHVRACNVTSGPLFTTERGALLRRGSFNEVFGRAVRASGLPEHTTFHDLRHTYASTALASGVPIVEVSRWLGHAFITETVDTYGHLLPEADDRMRQAMEQAYRRAESGRGAELVLSSAAP